MAAGGVIRADTGAGGARTFNATFDNQGTFIAAIPVAQTTTNHKASAAHQNSGTWTIASGTVTISGAARASRTRRAAQCRARPSQGHRRAVHECRGDQPGTGAGCDRASSRSSATIRKAWRRPERRAGGHDGRQPVRPPGRQHRHGDAERRLERHARQRASRPRSATPSRC